MPRLIGWPYPSLADMMYLVGFLGSIQVGSVMLSADGDPARHLAIGEHMLTTGRILDTDLFSHTMAGHPFMPHEWLAEVASAASYRLAGAAGPVMLHGAAIGLAFATLFGHLRAGGRGGLLSLFVTMLALWASMIHWLARPHVFTFLGTAFFSAVLADWYARGPQSRRVWLLPPAMVLWANVHPGFLIGLLLGGAYLGSDVLRWLSGAPELRIAAAQRLRALAPVGVVTALAALLTPAGFEVVEYVTSYSGKSLLLSRTPEYMSPDLHRPEMVPFLLMLLGTAAALAWGRRVPPLHEGLIFLGFTYFALQSGRHIPLFAILTAPLLAAPLASLPAVEGSLRGLADRLGASVRRVDGSISRMEPLLAWHAWPIALTIASVMLAASQYRDGLDPLGVRFHPERQPVSAVAYLKSNLPEGNGFNELSWGGYLLHELWLRQRVFIDGQTDFYGEALARDYFDVVELADNWQDVLNRHTIRWVIYETDSGLTRRLAATPGWRAVYRDELATVLVRSP